MAWRCLNIMVNTLIFSQLFHVGFCLFRLQKINHSLSVGFVDVRYDVELIVMSSLETMQIW